MNAFHAKSVNKILAITASLVTATSLINYQPVQASSNSEPIQSPPVLVNQSKQTSPAPLVIQKAQITFLPVWLTPLIMLGVFIVLIPHVGFLFGLVVIGEKDVGIAVKKFASKGLPAGRLIAINKEAGYQVDTLAPGWHWGYWPWQFSVKKEPLVIIPQGEIGLVVANDGKAIPPERILGQDVECDNYQDGRKFLTKGGEKRQTDRFYNIRDISHQYSPFHHNYDG